MNKKLIIISIILATLITSCNLGLYEEPGELELDKHSTIARVFDKDEFVTTKVENLKASRNNIGVISLTWDANIDATLYIIERASETAIKVGNQYRYPSNIEVKDDAWTVIKHLSGSITSFDDTNLENNTIYMYRIKSMNSDSGLYSKYSDIIKSNALGEARALIASKAKYDTEISLEWEPALGATTYKIHGESKSGKIDKIVTGTNYQFVMEGERGVAWTYTVAAMNYNGKEAKVSNESMGYTSVEGAPAIVDNLKASVRKEKLKLTWKKPIDIANTYYILNRKNLENNNIVSILSGTKANTLQISVDGDIASFVDSSAVAGVSYTYYISAYSKLGDKKLYNAEVSSTGSILSLPKDFSINKNTDGDFILSSENIPVGFEDFDSISSNYQYTIKNITYVDHITSEYPEYKDSFNQPVKNLADITQSITKDNVKLNINLGKNRPITMSFALEEVGGISSKVWTGNIDVVAKQSVNVTNNQYIGELDVNEMGLYPVKISWEKNKNIGIAYVYRCLENSSDFKYIGKTINGDVYLDNKDTKIGKKYKYSVIIEDKAGRLSSPTEPKLGYGALNGAFYFKLYDRYAGHIWYYVEEARQEIKKTIDGGGMGALKTVTMNGKVQGTLTYSGAIASISTANINFTLKDFRELSWFDVTGNFGFETGTSETGDYHGFITIKGMYPGTIDYKNIKLNSGSTEGPLGITQNNGRGLEIVAYPQTSFKDSAIASWTVEE